MRGSLSVRWGAYAWLAVASATASVACGSADVGGVPRGSVYVGAVTGTDAAVAVVASDAGTRVYVCGGPRTIQTFTRWFSAAGGALGAGLRTDGWEVRGAVTSDHAAGALVSPDGDVFDWSARSVRGASLEGLYRAQVDGCATGVVVSNDERGEPRFQGAWCDARGRWAQVTPVRPVERRGDGFVVRVDAQVDVTFVVDRVMP